MAHAFFELLISLYLGAGVYTAGVHRGEQNMLGKKVSLVTTYKIITIWPWYALDLHRG